MSGQQTVSSGSGGIDMTAMKRLYEAFQQGEPPTTPPPQPKQGAGTQILETLFNELVQVEKVVLEATKPTKPATLKGKFAYADSTLTSTAKRLTAFEGSEISGGKVTRTMVNLKIGTIRSKLVTAQNTQTDLSLKQVTDEANDYTAKTMEFAKQAVAAQKLAGDEQAKAKAKLYQDASALQVKVGVAVADWTGHVKEAGIWLVLKAGDFNKQIARITKSEADLSRIIESSLPQLASRPLNPGEKKPDVPGATVPPIGDGDPGAEEAMEKCHYNWVEAKNTYGADKDVMQKLADYRKRVVDKWLNDHLIPYGLAYGPAKGWVSVGSADPTSDYDISINKHGTVDGKPGSKTKFDYEMVKEFNAWFRGEYGAEGGTVFDTNLYASAPPLVQDSNPDDGSVNDIASLMKLRRYMAPGEFEDFRVETMKACADSPEHQAKVEHQFAMADNNYRMIIADLIENGAKQLHTRIEQRKSDGNLAGEVLEQHEEEVKLHEEAVAWLAKGNTAKGISAYELQDEGEALSREIDHHLKDAALLTTNEVYAEKTGAVRNQEEIAKLFSDINASVKKAASASPEQLPGLKDQLIGELKAAKASLKTLKVESKSIDDLIAALEKGEAGMLKAAVERLSKQLAEELGGHMQKLGDLSTIARYYANEAYQSDGPFAHVVTATQAAEAEATNKRVSDEMTKGNLPEGAKKDAQGKDREPKTLVAMARAGGVEAFNQLDPEKQKELLDAAQKDIDGDVKTLKKERQDALPADQCLQSFNEQLGDFLKDLEHYGDAEPGKAIIQSSKYLERLQDATRLMFDKDLFKDAGSALSLIQAELDMQGKVKGQLIAARKGNLVMVPEQGNTPVDQQEQRRAFACKFMKDLGVKSVGDLAKRYRNFGMQVNAIARKALAKQPPQGR